jgi:hypothetical protein
LGFGIYSKKGCFQAFLLNIRRNEEVTWSRWGS